VKTVQKTKTNQVQQTILEQLNSLDPTWRMEYRVETIGLIDENTIRLCCRHPKHFVNFDIHYKPVPDAYDVKAYLIYGVDYATVIDVKEVMWDQLVELLREAHGDVQICNQCGRSVKPGTGLFVNRVPSFDDAETRAEAGYPHPEGDFTCAECDEDAHKEP
jgi:hypothetical protein